MGRSGAPVPFLTLEEYYGLIEEAAYHLACSSGFKDCSLAQALEQAEKRVLNLISDVAVQYVGNTRRQR